MRQKRKKDFAEGEVLKSRGFLFSGERRMNDLNHSNGLQSRVKQANKQDIEEKVRSVR